MRSDPGVGEYYEKQRVRAVKARAALTAAEEAYNAAVIVGAGQNEMNALIKAVRHARRELEDALYVGD